MNTLNRQVSQNQNHTNQNIMKSYSTCFIVLAISSLANANNCLIGCWDNFDGNFVSLRKCISNCPRGNSSTNEVTGTKSSSLRGYSTPLTNLVNEAMKEKATTDVDLVEVSSRCGRMYSACSSNADCCGQLVCRDLGSVGYFSVSLCDDNARS